MFSRLMAGLSAALVACALVAPVSAQQNKQLALNNVSGVVGSKLAGKTCVGAWEVDKKVGASPMDYAAFRIIFSGDGGVLTGTFEFYMGERASKNPHLVVFRHPAAISDVKVIGTRLTFKSPSKVDWAFDVSDGQTVELARGRFDPSKVRPDWSPGGAWAKCH